MATFASMNQDELRAVVEERPKNSRARARLACLIAEQCTHNDQNASTSLVEAQKFAQEAIETAPHQPYGYAALSSIHPDFGERMKLIQQAVDLSADPRHRVAKIGLLLRLLCEPLAEESGRVNGTIGKASKEHPSRRDLNDQEAGLYASIEDCLEEVWSKHNELTPSQIEFLALRDYKLGTFFRKRDPASLHQPRSMHHFQRAASKLPDNHTNKSLSQFWLATLSSQSSKNTRRCPAEYVVGLYSTFAERFDDLLVEKLDYRTPTLLRRLLEDTVEVAPGKWRRALDLGCGTGLSGLAFRDCVQYLHGIDLSPQMIEQARKRECYDSFIVGDVETGGWDEISDGFSLVLACDVFVYLGDLKPVFDRVSRRLFQEGIFVFSTELLADKDTAPNGDTYLLHSCGRFAHRYVLFVQTDEQVVGTSTLTSSPPQSMVH